MKRDLKFRGSKAASRTIVTKKVGNLTQAFPTGSNSRLETPNQKLQQE
jgi:hypothetical protein